MNTKLESLYEGGITSPKGFSAGATYAGIKKKTENVLDLGILYSEVTCQAAAVFTTNKIKAAPVILDKSRIDKTGQARAVIVNSGCANACTGDQGMKAAIEISECVAQKLNIPADEVMVASTGVIGVQLPLDKIKNSVSKVKLSREGGGEFTRAIMTTDTRLKSIAVKVKVGNDEFVIGGTCKGAGMIHPNMATMLGFITTDASVEPGLLKSELKKAVDLSFNMVSVDGDTSTNDTVLIMANGLAGNQMIIAKSNPAKAFSQALQEVCIYLAKGIARDGEGATRMIEITVNGAASKKDAVLAARTISNSPLVKTAVHGCDPNWGRIIAAAGRSGAEVAQDKADVYIGNMCLLKSGIPMPFDKKAASELLKQDEVSLRVDLNLGKSSAKAWGCDLSKEYVTINADYTT